MEKTAGKRVNEPELRSNSPKPPRGWERIKWYGPGFLWMIAAVGSGTVLFTPRIGSLYGYKFVWAALIIFIFMWVVIREVGRFTVVSGKTILEGYRSLPGPRGWAVWVFILPALLSGMVSVAGISALIGSLLSFALPGNQVFYATLIIIISLILVVTGRYAVVEQVTSVMGIVLIITAAVAAFLVTPSLGEIATGLVPGIPDNLDLYFVLPWFGFLVAGPSGIVWFSYWVAARGYGGRVVSEGGISEGGEMISGKIDRNKLVKRLHGWIRIMTASAAIGVFGGGLISFSFLILGAEVLRPVGLVPEGIRVAEALTSLLSTVWGEFGFWTVILGTFLALWGTVLANQDGGGRTFADATILLLPTKLRRASSDGKLEILRPSFKTKERIKDFYSAAVTAVFPLVIFFILRDPVKILSVGGIIAAINTPVVISFTLYLNRTRLPQGTRPGILSTFIMVAAGIFYIAFAAFFVMNLRGSGT